jgi:ankyrin repeat protein
MAIPVEEVKAMFAAVDGDDADAIRELIRRRADVVDAQRPDGLSALLYAMYVGKWEIVDVIAPVHPGLDVFESAALGRGARVKHLTTTNPKLLAKRTPDGWTALHLAAFFGQIETVRVLIGQGADVNARSQNQMANCPLHSAAAGRHYLVCELLLANGADVNATQHGGFTALMAAAQHGDQGLVDLLLRRGAMKAARTAEGQSAADIAAAAGHAALAELLR